jgi:hypothetical protein
MKLGYLGSGAVVVFSALIGTASAATFTGTTAGCSNTCTITVITAPSTYTQPTPLPFTPLDLGTSLTAGGHGTSPVIPAGSGITSITFPGAGTVSPFSGVYSGNTTSVALSPFGGGPGNSNTPTNNYLVAQGGGGEVDVTYAAPQTTLEMLWGTVDPTPSTYNMLTFTAGGATITGADLDTITGGLFTANPGAEDVAVLISGLASFTVLKASDAATAAFEFDVASVPAPTIGQGLPVLLALGGMLLGMKFYKRGKGQSIGAAAA